MACTSQILTMVKMKTRDLYGITDMLWRMIARTTLSLEQGRVNKGNGTRVTKGDAFAYESEDNPLEIVLTGENGTWGKKGLVWAKEDASEYYSGNNFVSRDRHA